MSRQKQKLTWACNAEPRLISCPPRRCCRAVRHPGRHTYLQIEADKIWKRRGAYPVAVEAIPKGPAVLSDRRLVVLPEGHPSCKTCGAPAPLHEPRCPEESNAEVSHE